MTETKTEQTKFVKWQVKAVDLIAPTRRPGDPFHPLYRIEPCAKDAKESEEVARQIAREHNAFPALVEACEGVLDHLYCHVKGRGFTAPRGLCDCSGCEMSRQIRIALALAERGEA